MTERRQAGGRALRFFLAFGALFVLVAFVAAALPGGSGRYVSMTGDERIAMVPLRGEITSSDQFVDALEEIGRDDSIGAVVVRVNSPGGGVAPSQEMYAAILRLRQRKPVIASLGSVAASGGYYVASAADVIVANPGSLTGSIGVIMQMTNLEGLLEKVGVQAEIVTAGRQKDMGSPFRPLTPAERSIFQSIADQVHEQFIEAVARGRGLSPAAIEAAATGRIFTGEQALEVGLVDELGGLWEAVRIAADRAGIPGDPEVEEISPNKVPWWLRAVLMQGRTLAIPSLGEDSSVLDFLEAISAMGEGGRLPLFLWRAPLLTSGAQT